MRTSKFFDQLRGRIYEALATQAADELRKLTEPFSETVVKLTEDLSSLLTQSSGSETTLSLPSNYGKLFEQLDFLNDIVVSLDARGDGIKALYIPNILQYIAKVKAKHESMFTTTFIWAYEESENNLEMRRAWDLADRFNEIAQGEHSQVLLVTHAAPFYHKALKSEIGRCHRVSLSDPEQGSRVVEIHKSTDLDESMGLMELVAPYLKRVNEDLKGSEQARSELEKSIKAPTVFVEGDTDQMFFERLIQLDSRFRTDVQVKGCGGASKVADMVISYHFAS